MTTPRGGAGSANAAFTIVSASHLPAARVLARSYRRAHPSHRFLVVLIDGTSAPMHNEPFELVHINDIALPNPGVFPFQFDLRELGSAVKPFCIRHVLAMEGVERLLYLDADIMVFRGLDEAWAQLDSSNVLLTPFCRKPFHDHMTPSDASLLSSGVFNLGFIALKRSAASDAMLDWWCEKIFSNQSVSDELERHPEQKWMDLAPVYFDGVQTLGAPAYNVAYWNLHERTIADTGSGFLVDGVPLGFFHFSGYDPSSPDRLSRHQSRHWLVELPAVKRICDLYAQELLQAGEPIPAVAPLRVLDNGVPVTRLINLVVRQCIRRGIVLPSPGKDADGFCRFITTPNPAVFGADVAPVVTAILDLREDVDAAFPGARRNKDHSGMRQWLWTHGRHEENLATLFDHYAENLRDTPPLAEAVAIYERRGDLRAAFPDVWGDDVSYRKYGEWLFLHGRTEEGVDDHLIGDYLSARDGFHKVLDKYFSRPDLLAGFPLLLDDAAIAGVIAGIAGVSRHFPSLTRSDLLAFELFARARKDRLVLAVLRYNAFVRNKIGGAPSLFNSAAIQGFLDHHGAGDYWPLVHETLLGGAWIPPVAQFVSCAGPSTRGPQAKRDLDPDAAAVAVERFAEHHPDSANHPLFAAWKHQLLTACARPLLHGINLYGPLNDASGMGESSRSMTRTLTAAHIPCRTTRFPGSLLEHAEQPLPEIDRLYGGVDERLDTNLVVANADTTEYVRRWLPVPILPDRCNLAYWVWETEALPLRFKKATVGLDAILTPSEYSARAIRAVADIPVHTVPHTLDFVRLATAAPNRAAFGLPETIPLFGFFFDSNSVIERKNPGAVIDAFRAAFGTRRDVGLVLKVNAPHSGNYDYSSLRARAQDLNVTWVERAMSHDDAMCLLSSLSVYVSMHRSEGFGLALAEAMALGKPVIATGYSGNLQFMDAGSALLVDHRVGTTDRPYGPYPAGSRWADPSVAHCATLMRTLLSEEPRSAIGAAAERHVRHLLDPIVIGQRMSDVLMQVNRLRARRVRKPRK